MRRSARIGWIVVGVLITVPTVLVTAATVTTQVIWPHRSYESDAVSGFQLSETSRYAYTLYAPQIFVETTGKVTVSLIAGQSGRMVVERERLWYQESRSSFNEKWDNGQTLKLGADCPAHDRRGGPVCRLDYTLTVPAGTDVTVSSPQGITSCSPKSAKAACVPRANG